MNYETYARSLGIGAVAGLRSMTAPAATLVAGENALAGLAIFAAAGEFVVDKLPIAPARTLPPALIVRVLAGGLCGGVVARRRDGSRAIGILAGAAGAIAATYAGYEIRRLLTKTFDFPDPAVAVVEDAIAIWGARAATALAA